MKKSGALFILILVVLCSSISVNAQEPVEFTVLTVAQIFNWGASEEKVYDFVSNIEGLSCERSEDDVFGKIISCETEGLKDEITLYTFFFTDDDTLFMIEGSVNYLGNEITTEQIYEHLAANFSEIEMEPYNTGTFYDALAADASIAGCGLIPDASYVCILGFEETDDTYPYVSVFYAHPEFVQGLDSAE